MRIPPWAIVLSVLGVAFVATAEIVSSERRIVWQPGIPGGIPDASATCPASAPSVIDFGAVGDGLVDDYPAFEAAIQAASQGSVIRIPEGSYLLRTGLSIDKGVILCGEGSDKSRLLFDCAQNAISIVKYDRGDFVAVSAGAGKDSTQLTIADASSFSVGNFAELQQENDWDVMDPENYWRDPAQVDWVPENCVGQMFEVLAVSGNTITVDPPLHLDYNPAMNPQIRPIGLVSGAGIQGLYLTRLNTADLATLEIKNAAYCWMRDCESENTFRAHVTASSALRCELRHNYMHHAYDYGGGGHGYGVTLGNHVTDFLVEDNIFVHLRHAMMVQAGASGNVYGYNYSVERESEGSWTPCDISLHGHYTNMNLFEGNTIQEVDVADYWGPCGPGNTFLRNRVESEGIQVMDYSQRQNLVGNELTSDQNVISEENNVQDTLAHGNYQDGSILWDPAISDHEIPVSYFHDSKPSFFGCTPWPATGADLAPDGLMIPAEQRQKGILVECDGGDDGADSGDYGAGDEDGVAGDEAGGDDTGNSEADPGDDDGGTEPKADQSPAVKGGCGCATHSVPGGILLILMPIGVLMRRPRKRGMTQ